MKIGDKVKFKDIVFASFFSSSILENKDFYVKDILGYGFSFPIVLSNINLGEDWVEFFNEVEVVLDEL